MKRIIPLALILCLIFCGCGINKPTEPGSEESTDTTAVSDKPFFMLDALPDIGKFSQDKLYKRWYKEYTDELKTRSDYGELIPFIGDCRYYEEAENHAEEKYGYYSPIYGLMTTNGEIVVDAVYESIYEIELDGEVHYALVKSIPFKDAEGWYGSKTETTITKTDGSKAFTVSGYVAGDSNNGRICVVSAGQEYEGTTSVYDYDGNFIFKAAQGYNAYGSYRDGLLCCTDYSSEALKSIAYDVNGKTVFEIDGEIAAPFKNGKAVVYTPSVFENIPGKQGIINTQGKWLLKPIYDSIQQFDNGYYAVRVLGKEEILDENLNTIVKKDSNDAWYSSTDKKIFYNIDGYYYDGLTDEPIVCKENGAQATGYFYESGYFAAKQDKACFLFDSDGKTVCVIENTGELFGFDETMFYICSDKGTVHTETYYDFSGNEVLSLQYDDSKGYKSVEYTPELSRFLLIHEYNSDTDIKKVRIFDREKGEYLDKILGLDCRAADVCQAGGKIYISLAFDSYVCVYEEDFNMIFKATNQYTD